MIIGHSRPAILSWSVVGQDAAIVTPTELLEDGRPDTVTRFRWPAGTQNTSTYIGIRLTWADARAPGLVLLSNVRLPIGTRIEFGFRRVVDPPGTYSYVPAAWNPVQRVVAGPRGERTAAILLKPGVQPSLGCEVRIHNDVNGVPSIPASMLFELGELVVCETATVDIEADWSTKLIDSSFFNSAGREQLFGVPGVVKRQLSFRFPADDQAMWFGGGAQLDYEALIARLDRGQHAVYITRHLDANGAFSAAALHRTAAIGVMTSLPGSTHEDGPYFRGDAATVVEVPIPT